MYEHQTSTAELAFVDAYNTLRFEFMQGLVGDIHADIQTPAFNPKRMSPVAVVAEILKGDGRQQLIAQLLRVVVLATESSDAVVSGSATALCAKLARLHALTHREELQQ